MADVSVEFGAQDTGLEATLKTIQAEISRLETEIKSGTLSFEEIAKKMREIKQSQGIFTQLGGEVKSATDSVQGLKEQMRLAETITKANRTAIEVYSDTVDELQKHLDAGTISQKTYASAIEKAEAALKSATPQTEEAKQANRELEEALKKAEQETRSLSEEQKKAEAITRSNRSATQIYNDEVSELHKHLNEGRISMETFATAVAKADAKLSAAAPQIGKDALEMGDNVKKGSDKGGMSLGELAKASGVAGAAFAAGMAVFNTAMKGVQAVAASFGNALNLGGQLADLSAQTGVAAGELLVLQRAFDNAGAGAEQVSPAIAKMSSTIVDATSGTGAAAKAFEQLGLSASELINLPAEQQFQKIGNALAGVANETQRSALASDLFGGNLGKNLLPLMTNFSGETLTATQQLGAMVGVMNESSDAFNAISGGIKVAQGKLTEFAAGLLSVMTPAIEAVVTALTRIDAAQIGKDLGLAFVGAGEAMKGFQGAVDAFDAGDMSLALKSIFESVKLQAMETANSIYKNLTSAFQTAGDFIATMFAPSGALATTIVSAFEFIGNKASASIMRTLAAGFAGNVLTEGIALSLNTAANQANKTANEMEASLSGAGTRIAEQFAKAGAAMPENFAKHQAALTAGFINTEEQAKKVAAVQEEINAAAGKHPELIAAAKAEMQKLNEAESESTLLAIEKATAASATHEAKMLEVKLQIALNDAIATGNTAEQARLEAIIEAEKGTARIKALTEEYAKSMPVGEAARLANEIYRSESNMLALKKAATNTKPELTNIGTLLGKINEADAAEPVRNLTKETKTAATDLKGISKIINVDISGGSPVDMMKKLGLDPYAVTGSKEQLDEVNKAINILKGADPADLTPKVDQVGVQDNIDAIQTYIKSKFAEATTAAVKATADKNAADNAAGDIKDKVGLINSQITTQTDDNNIQSTRATIEKDLSNVTAVVAPEVDGAAQQSARAELEKVATDVPMTVKADQAQIDNAVGALQAEIKNEFTGGEGGPGGEGGQGGEGGVGGDADADVTSITNIIDPWTKILEAIRDGLPRTALA